jgi:hypothetical protein
MLMMLAPDVVFVIALELAGLEVVAESCVSQWFYQTREQRMMHCLS